MQKLDLTMKIKPRLRALSMCALAWLAAPAFSATFDAGAQKQTLNQLIEQAISMDASREQYYAQSSALRDMGAASATLMDPKIKLGIGGLPVNTFKFDQDPMTNISVGLMQQFERGSTLSLMETKANQQADGMGYQINARELEVANSMTQLWLELGYQQAAEEIIKENKSLLSELSNLIQSNYAIGKNEVQDLLNAQLQISKLEDNLQANEQTQQRIVAQFSTWLGVSWLSEQPSLKATNHLNWEELTKRLKTSPGSEHYNLLNQNPMVKMAQAAIAANETQVDIAGEAYKPQFGIEVMYAYRQANGMNGQPAPDLLSAYLTLDIPLFTGKKQDKTYAASQYQVGAAKSQKSLLLTQMNATVNALIVDKTNLEERIERYQLTLIEQAKARTKAVERGYENNTVQFNDVISATRDELTLKLERQRLVTDLNIVKSNLASLLGGFEFKATQPFISEPTGRL